MAYGMMRDYDDTRNLKRCEECGVEYEENDSGYPEPVCDCADGPLEDEDDSDDERDARESDQVAYDMAARAALNRSKSNGTDGKR